MYLFTGVLFRENDHESKLGGRSVGVRRKTWPHSISPTSPSSPRWHPHILRAPYNTKLFCWKWCLFWVFCGIYKWEKFLHMHEMTTIAKLSICQMRSCFDFDIWPPILSKCDAKSVEYPLNMETEAQTNCTGSEVTLTDLKQIRQPQFLLIKVIKHTICLQWSCQHLSIFFRKSTLSRASVWTALRQSFTTIRLHDQHNAVQTECQTELIDRSC